MRAYEFLILHTSY